MCTAPACACCTCCHAQLPATCWPYKPPSLPPAADSTLNHWPFPWNHLHEGYAYILTHPGTPCVFYDHQWQEGLRQTIEKLIKIRKDMGISNRSKVLFKCFCRLKKRCSWDNLACP